MGGVLGRRGVARGQSRTAISEFLMGPAYSLNLIPVFPLSRISHPSLRPTHSSTPFPAPHTLFHTLPCAPHALPHPSLRRTRSSTPFPAPHMLFHTFPCTSHAFTTRNRTRSMPNTTAPTPRPPHHSPHTTAFNESGAAAVAVAEALTSQEFARCGACAGWRGGCGCGASVDNRGGSGRGSASSLCSASACPGGGGEGWVGGRCEGAGWAKPYWCGVNEAEPYWCGFNEAEPYWCGFNEAGTILVISNGMGCLGRCTLLDPVQPRLVISNPDQLGLAQQPRPDQTAPSHTRLYQPAPSSTNPHQAVPTRPHHPDRANPT
eukprot:354685-Chlamydomonas_euryale.AAC.2